MNRREVINKLRQYRDEAEEGESNYEWGTSDYYIAQGESQAFYIALTLVLNMDTPAIKRAK